MDIVLKKCDRCKQKDAAPFMIVRQIGGEEVAIDLCANCTAMLLRRVMAAMTPQQQTKLTREVLAYRKASGPDAT